MSLTLIFVPRYRSGHQKQQTDKNKSQIRLRVAPIVDIKKNHDIWLPRQSNTIEKTEDKAK